MDVPNFFSPATAYTPFITYALASFLFPHFGNPAHPSFFSQDEQFIPYEYFIGTIQKNLTEFPFFADLSAFKSLSVYRKNILFSTSEYYGYFISFYE